MDFIIYTTCHDTLEGGAGPNVFNELVICNYHKLYIDTLFTSKRLYLFDCLRITMPF